MNRPGFIFKRGNMIRDVSNLDRAVEPGELFHEWILFDHQWAAAFPNLAISLLRLASRWDVL